MDQNRQTLTVADLDAIERLIDERLDEKLTPVKDRLDGIDDRLDGIDNRLEVVTEMCVQGFSSLGLAVANVRGSLSDLKQRPRINEGA